MVPAPRVCAEAVGVRRRIPVATEVGILRLADRVFACCGVDDGSAAATRVVVAETYCTSRPRASCK
jgi:hypothetical protein